MSEPEATEPAAFYTGLVATLYTPLRTAAPDADIYAHFIERFGQPALELGCGSGDPILELRQRGLDVDGIDASADMLAIARERADQLGVEINVLQQRIETMNLGRSYKSIFLAGPTFNLLPDDPAALAALRGIAKHLDSDGAALIPLFVPPPLPPEAIGNWRDDVDAEGRSIRFTAIAATRDEYARLQTSVLRYERGAEDAADVEAVERPFVVHWYTVPQFRDLATEAGLVVNSVRDFTGAPADDDAHQFAFTLTL